MANFVPTTPILGNLTWDPEIYDEGDKRKQRATFAVAVNTYNPSTEEESSNGFYFITLFGQPGVNFANSFSKGDRIMALCRLSTFDEERFDADGHAYNHNAVRLTAVVAGGTTEFNEIQLIGNAPVAKQPRRTAAKARRPEPGDETPGDRSPAENSGDEVTQRRTSGQAPARRPAARRPAARRRAAA